MLPPAAPAPTAGAPGVATALAAAATPVTAARVAVPQLPDPAMVLPATACPEALPSPHAVVALGPGGLWWQGQRLADVACRVGGGPCDPGKPPPDHAVLRLQREDLRRASVVTVLPALAQALHRRPAGHVLVALDARVQAWTALVVLDTCRAAGAEPSLLGVDSHGALRPHWPSQPAGDELPPPAPVAGAEVFPDDVTTLVLALASTGARLTLVRDGGGALHRPCGSDWRRCVQIARAAIAAAPGLAEVTVELAPEVSTANAFAAVEALRGGCAAPAGCALPGADARAVAWIGRGVMAWVEDPTDAARGGGEPPPPPSPPAVVPAATGLAGRAGGEGPLARPSIPALGAPTRGLWPAASAGPAPVVGPGGRR